MNNGSLTINGGIFEGTDAAAVVNTAEAEELVIEAGSFVANNVDTFAIEYVAAETVTINKGEFTGAAPADMDKLVGEGVGATTNKDGNLVFAPAVITTVTNTDELLAAFANAQSGETIVADGVNYRITGADHFEIPAGITLRGLTITAAYRGGNYVTYGSGDDAITFENCSFGNSDRSIIVAGFSDGPDSVIFKNCTFTGQVITNYVDNTDGVAEFYNCLFTKSPSGLYNFLEGMGGSHIFYNCTFDYTGLSQSSMGVLSTATLNVYSESDGSYATYIETNGCKFINCGTRKYGAKSTLVIK